MFRVSKLVVCVPLLALAGCWDNEDGSLEQPLAGADAGLGIADPTAPSRPARDAGGAPDDRVADADLTDPGSDDGDASAIEPDAQLQEPDTSADAGSALDAGEPRDAGETLDGGQQPDGGPVTDAGHALDSGSAADAGKPSDAGLDAGNQDAGKPYTGIPDAAVKVPVTVVFAPSPVADASFTAVYAILQSRCRNCHGSSFNYSLDLSARQIAHEELVSGPNAGAAEFISCEKPGVFRVIPADPGNSLIIQKLFNVQHCGDRMPTNGTLSDAERSVIWTWIARGALND